MDIHVTSRSNFRTCRRKYRYQEVDRISPKDTRADALWFGRGCHEALRAYYKDGVHPVVAWNEFVACEKTECPQELNLLATSILDHYYDYAREHDDWDEIVAVETPLRVPIPDTKHHHIIATMDLIVKRRGAIWIVDHKFLSRVPSQKNLELDDQMTAYLWAAKQSGINAVGAIYNIIKKKVPTVPRLLVNGTLSKSSEIETTYDVYLKTLHQHGLDPANYQDILQKLKDKPQSFFIRELIARNTRELNSFHEDLIAEVKDMTRTPMRYYPNAGLWCQWCPYQFLCKCESEGGDTSLVRKEMFREKEIWER